MLKSFLVTAVFIVSSQLYAGNILKLTKGPLTINQCALNETNETMDLALLNNGYFVVSSGKKSSELSFTRFGKLYVDADHYIRTDLGNYLLAMAKKSAPNNLKKIQIPTDYVAPKATSKIKIKFNLPANGLSESVYTSIHDSLSNTSFLELQLTKIADNKWSAEVFSDHKVSLDKGILVFNTSGLLSKQEGLDHVQWPVDYGMQELKINFNGSTQYNSPFAVNTLNTDGHSLGVLVTYYFNENGQIVLHYNNGIMKTLNQRIAVAKFSEPTYLENVSSHLYKPTEKSGQPMIYWTNSERAVLSGYLEEETCAVR